MFDLKIKFLSSLVIALFIFVSPVRAAEAWTIENFNSNISVQENGVVHVNETIKVNFGNLQKHGIFRDIPYQYILDMGQKYSTQVEVQGVTLNDEPVLYTISRDEKFIHLKVGDPQKIVSGRLKYTITYRVIGALRSFSDHDELYWDITGQNWPVPITKTSTTVTLPKAGITKITCFQGKFNSTTSCKPTLNSKSQASFQTSIPLNAQEDLTIVVGFTKGIVPILTVTPAPTQGTNPETFKSIAYFNLLAFALTFGIGLAVIISMWWQKGSDLWWKRSRLYDPDQPPENRPPGTYEPLVVEYTPPAKLHPAQIGTLIDERADTLDVSATIIDLASRGFLTITEKPKKWVLGSVDYVLTKKSDKTEGLLEYEKTLLTHLFEIGDSVSLSTLKNKFYDDLKLVKDKLYQDLVGKKFFETNPEKIRQRYLGIGIVLLIVGLSLAFTFFLSGIGFALIILGLLLIFISRVMPRRTALGHEMFRRSLGYRLFIDKAEKYRQQFFEKKNMFNEILPYAIMFGLTEKFARIMKDLEIKPNQPTWYTSNEPFDPLIFSNHITLFSNSVSSAITSTPASHSTFASSGSGFSGGFSGGGFGGGGGGSW